ncbi:MAG: NUDIX domain-containing protein [Acidobacteriota bacterium]
MTFTSEDRAALTALLEAHHPASEIEARHLTSIREFVDRTDDPFDRGVVEGHLTGSAFVLDSDERMLLTHHRKLGLWLNLGGHAESERRAGAVAMREATEESRLSDLVFDPRLLDATGEPRLLDVDVHAIPERKGEPEHWHFDLRFLIRTLSPERAVADPSESKGLEWLPLDAAVERGDGSMGRGIARIRAL